MPYTPSTRHSLLLIEDSPSDARLFREVLSMAPAPHMFSVTVATTLAAGLETLRKQQFAAVLLDLGLPDSSGLRSLERLLAAAPEVPILVVTSFEDDRLARDAVAKGAQDYLFKGNLEPFWVSRAIVHALERFELGLRLRRAEAAEAASARHASQAKSDFVARMAHELRTPVSTILCASEMLNDAPTRINPVEIIKRTARYLLDLVNVTLDLSKIEAGCLELVTEPFDLEQALAEAMTLHGLTAAAKGLTLETTCADGAPKVALGDPLRCRQILANVLGNAVKFTPTGGKVTVTLARDDWRGQVTVAVADTGCGIPLPRQELLFRPYAQGAAEVSHRYGGTGLGLSLSRQLARAMHGDLQLVASVEGGGSTFLISLPLADGDAAYASSVESEKGAKPLELHGRRLLVVEDDPDALRLLSTLLRRSWRRRRDGGERPRCRATRFNTRLRCYSFGYGAAAARRLWRGSGAASAGLQDNDRGRHRCCCL